MKEEKVRWSSNSCLVFSSWFSSLNQPEQRRLYDAFNDNTGPLRSQASCAGLCWWSSPWSPVLWSLWAASVTVSRWPRLLPPAICSQHGDVRRRWHRSFRGIPADLRNRVCYHHCCISFSRPSWAGNLRAEAVICDVILVCRPEWQETKMRLNPVNLV